MLVDNCLPDFDVSYVVNWHDVTVIVCNTVSVLQHHLLASVSLHNCCPHLSQRRHQNIKAPLPVSADKKKGCQSINTYPILMCVLCSLSV